MIENLNSNYTHLNHFVYIYHNSLRTIGICCRYIYILLFRMQSTEAIKYDVYSHHILILHLCVRESGRSREAILPELKTFSFSSKLKSDSTYDCQLTCSGATLVD